jgi:hypothetical protein
MVFFVIGAALILAAKAMAKRHTSWPPALLQQMQQRGLASPGAHHPFPSSSAASGSQGSQGFSRFNSPPGWPVPPPDWTPSPDWVPDPSWPPAPPGWQFWSTDSRTAE